MKRPMDYSRQDNCFLYFTFFLTVMYIYANEHYIIKCVFCIHFQNRNMTSNQHLNVYFGLFFFTRLKEDLLWKHKISLLTSAWKENMFSSTTTEHKQEIIVNKSDFPFAFMIY